MQLATGTQEPWGQAYVLSFCMSLLGWHLFRASDQHISTKFWELDLVLISYHLWSYSVALLGWRISEVLKPELKKDRPEVWVLVLLRSGPVNARVPNPTKSMFCKYFYNIYLMKAQGKWFAVIKYDIFTDSLSYLLSLAKARSMFWG